VCRKIDPEPGGGAIQPPHVAQTVQAFCASAERHQVTIDVIAVPDGQHSFDMLDHTETSRAAVNHAIDRITAALTR
jgi:dienelactone hydrolase